MAEGKGEGEGEGAEGDERREEKIARIFTGLMPEGFLKDCLQGFYQECYQDCPKENFDDDASLLTLPKTIKTP